MKWWVFLSVLSAMAFAQNPNGFSPSWIDRSADPCMNFYQYACGGWIAANPIPSDRGRYGSFDALQERNRAVLQNILETDSANKATRSTIDREIGDYYYACMDEKGIDAKGLTPLKADLDRIAAMKEKSQVTAEASALYRLGTNPFFFFFPQPDPNNSALEIPTLYQGGLSLPDRDYYFRTDPKSVEIRAKFLAHVTKMFELAGSTPADAKKKADAVMALETALAKGSLDNVARRDPNKTNNSLKVKDLAARAPGFDWAAFFREVGAPQFDTLNVEWPDFVNTVQTAITTSSLDDLKAYFTWHLLHDSSSVLPLKFREETFDFYSKTLGGVKQMRARWKVCVDQVDEQLSDALSQKFIEKTLGEAGTRRARQMVQEIEKAMGQDIEKIDWMTPKTKEQALIKLHAVANKIGTKDPWIDYSTVKIARDDAFGNDARTTEFEVKRQLAKMGKPVDRTDWQMSQPTVNAYYDPTQNNINFPAGILQPPFWDNALDDAVNYGAIGAVIGHELTHAFDDQGSEYDPKGNLHNWWSKADKDAFDQREQCIVNEYSSFTAVDDVHVNGKLTLGENTADNGGLRLAYMALLDKLAGKQPAKLEGFTAEQRFFLGFGQIWCENITPEAVRQQAQTNPHSPAQFRVNGVVSNMPEFARAFSCKAGQPMVRGPACRVW